ERGAHRPLLRGARRAPHAGPALGGGGARRREDAPGDPGAPVAAGDRRVRQARPARRRRVRPPAAPRAAARRSAGADRAAPPGQRRDAAPRGRRELVGLGGEGAAMKRMLVVAAVLAACNTDRSAQVSVAAPPPAVEPAAPSDTKAEIAMDQEKAADKR